MSDDFLDMRTFQKEGAVSEPDFNRLCLHLGRALQGFRVPAIRKQLDFAPYDFEKYVEQAKSEHDSKYLPTPDPDLAFELNAIPVTLQTKFMLSFFPDFNREYDYKTALDFIAIERAEDGSGYAVIPPNQYRSLLLAGHQVETECKKRYKQSLLAKQLTGSLEVETTWLLPPTLCASNTDEMTLQVTFSLLLD